MVSQGWESNQEINTYRPPLCILHRHRRRHPSQFIFSLQARKVRPLGGVNVLADMCVYLLEVCQGKCRHL